MNPSDLDQLVSALLPAVHEAGKLQIELFRTGADVAHKADGSPVTQADQRSEEIIIRALTGFAPSIPIIAEEAISAGRQQTPGNLFFLVDPLDGTRQFIEGVPEFTINIGLIESARPVFGLIYAPARNELYFARAGAAAYHAALPVGECKTSLETLDLQSIKSREPNPKELEALVSRSHEKPENKAFLATLGVVNQRRIGSSLKFCLIAKGDSDLYARIGATSQWDTAAGQAILEAAGGAVLTLDGKTLEYPSSRGTWLNPHFVAWGRKPAA